MAYGKIIPLIAEQVFDEAKARHANVEALHLMTHDEFVKIWREINEIQETLEAVKRLLNELRGQQ
jgi:hypothetical protein